jgi:hypothetical protein
MDRDFIARNQVVERYLSGRLPLKGATDFERFCNEHPELLDEIGLPDRVNAGLRLLEASGKPEPWQEKAKPKWRRPEVTIALAAAVAALGLTLLMMGGNSAGKTRQIADLKKQLLEQPLDPATSTREIRRTPRGDIIAILARGATVSSSERFRNSVRKQLQQMQISPWESAPRGTEK